MNVTTHNHVIKEYIIIVMAIPTPPRRAGTGGSGYILYTPVGRFRTFSIKFNFLMYVIIVGNRLSNQLLEERRRGY